MSASYDVIVIGAGVAGMAAAKEAARRGLRVALAEEMMFGGLVINVNHLDPCPQDMAASGADLAADMMSSAADLGVETVMAAVVSIACLPSGDIRVETADGAHVGRYAIVASGARLRKLNVPGEAEFEHRGVSHCADCDGPLFRGETVVVVGGGDSALQQAAVLANFCSAVHCVHRSDAFSAREGFVRAVMSNPTISVHLDTVVDAIEGKNGVDAVRLRDVVSGRTASLPCRGVFAYVGLHPNTAFLPSAMHKEGEYLKVNDELETSMPNVYAIGAVRAGYAGQLTDAIDDAMRTVEVIYNSIEHV